MKLNKSTLKKLIKEELETMVAEERPPTNAELTMKRLRSLLPEFAAVDAKADALMGNQKRMMGTLDTLPPEVHAEYKKHYEDYGRANFGDSLREETLQEQTDPHAALEGAVAAALSRHASKLAQKKSEDVGKEIRDISRELSKEIADNFLKNFSAKQKD